MDGDAANGTRLNFYTNVLFNIYGETFSSGEVFDDVYFLHESRLREED